MSRDQLELLPTDPPQQDRWWPSALSAIDFLAASGIEFTSDDVRELAGDPAAEVRRPVVIRQRGR